MAKFDITAAFQAAVGAAGNVSKLDTSRETIEYISLDKLEADPGNFYILTAVDYWKGNAYSSSNVHALIKSMAAYVQGE